MADNLDDFFAKKDKSKKKISAKITPDDIMAMQEDELRRGKKLKKKTKETDEANLRKDQEEDNEWKEIEDEVKDFSGLRIQSLANTNGDERGDDKCREGAGDDDEETQRREGGQQGPWNKGKQSGPAELVEEGREVVKEVPVPVKEVPAAAPTPSKYVPPALRQAQLAAASSSGAASSPLSGGGKLKKKDAPNLKSEEDFPTLGGQEQEQEVGGVSYTTVGGRKADASATQQRPQLQLGNKFTALGDH